MHRLVVIRSRHSYDFELNSQSFDLVARATQRGQRAKITSKYGLEVDLAQALALERASLDRFQAWLLGTGLGLAVPC